MDKKAKVPAAQAAPQVPAEKKFDLEIEKKKNYVKVNVFGDITVKTVTLMKKRTKELIDEKNKNFVFDLSGSNYMDSSGLGFFIGTLKNLKEIGGALHITGLSAYVSGIFNLINLTSIVSIFEDPKEACKF